MVDSAGAGAEIAAPQFQRENQLQIHGIPTTGKFDGEIPLRHLKVAVSDHQNNPFGIRRVVPRPGEDRGARCLRARRPRRDSGVLELLEYRARYRAIDFHILLIILCGV